MTQKVVIFKNVCSYAVIKGLGLKILQIVSHQCFITASHRIYLITQKKSVFVFKSLSSGYGHVTSNSWVVSEGETVRVQRHKSNRQSRKTNSGVSYWRRGSHSTGVVSVLPPRFPVRLDQIGKNSPFVFDWTVLRWM